MADLKHKSLVNEVIDLWQSGEITAVKAMELTGLKKTTFYKLLKQQD